MGLTKRPKKDFTNYTWNVLVDRGEVILRCQDPAKDDKDSWWWIARIMYDGTLVRCAGLSTKLGLRLNDEGQVQLGDHG